MKLKVDKLFSSPLWVVFSTEIIKLLRSRKFKVLLAITLFPSVIYLLSPNPSGSGVEGMRKAFQTLMLDLLPNYWLGIIGQLIVIILMSDLLAGEIDRGTIRLLIAKPLCLSELVAAKFLTGLGTLLLLFGIPYAVIWLYNPVVYGAGVDGLWEGFSDLLYVLGVTALLMASIGALSMLLSVVISRPLYASLATFGLTFLLQFLIPQIPYISNPGSYTLGYRAVLLLRGGFREVDLSRFQGSPEYTALFFLSSTVLLPVLTWAALERREFPD
ncbi:ABC transporter permease [Thermococcus waiotapuensis]|uniref:ABC transporter permease subunit n=1 Tax=Thermococcus waiotapuensis TaxID=90909 RepID=A0AAE4NU81_9EURY|nr:ABC transporter permease subunit [Thermococcus waiotapuensis]MDV3103204.1 ABC transporter permease subunit [Thermococcus waiotapuensis]